MKAGSGLIAAMALGVALSVTVRATDQQAPQPPAQPQAPAQPPAIEGHGGPPPPGAQPPQAPSPPRPAGQGAPAGPGQGMGRFPAQQRPKADPAMVEQGRGIYVGSCGPCHGADARGGQLGGPNLLRSPLVLSDMNGEQIGPVVKNGRPGTIMVAMALPDDQIAAVVAYLHSLTAQIGGQGNPPPGPPVELDILVGDARRGQAYFQARCASCHQPTGDLNGIATRVAEPKALQNLWVSGGRAVQRGGGAARPVGAPRAVTTATITTPSGERVSGRLVRLDDFTVTIALEDGLTRTFRRVGDVPTLDITDPLDGHRDLLAVLTDADMHDVTAYLVTLK
jgi:cytochrome c oxidase cbb3-type subunit III